MAVNNQLFLPSTKCCCLCVLSSIEQVLSRALTPCWLRHCGTRYAPSQGGVACHDLNYHLRDRRR